MPEHEIFFNCVRLCVQDGLRVNAAVKELKSNYSFLLVIGAQSKKVTANYHCLIVTQDCRAVLQTWVSKQPVVPMSDCINLTVLRWIPANTYVAPEAPVKLKTCVVCAAG